MEELSADQASHLIGLIYDCVIEPARWQAAVDAMREQLGTPNASLSVVELTTGNPLAQVSTGIPAEWLSELPRYAYAIPDCWGGPTRINQFPADEPVLVTEAVALERLQRNDYFMQWARPQGLIDCLGLFSHVDGGRFAGFACGIHEAQPFHEFQRTGLRLLAPHIRRAISISGLLDMKSVAADTLDAALDALAPPIVLVAGDLTVVHANAAAREMLKNHDPIRNAGERLALPHPQGTAALADAVARCTGGLVALGQRGIGIPTRRRDGSPAIVHVMPLARKAKRPGLEQRAVAAVLVAPATAPPQMPAAALALLYDLTPAETRVLELVAEGKAPADVANHLGISLNTAKTHLKHVFEKTDCNRQADLVRLVGSLALPV